MDDLCIGRVRLCTLHNRMGLLPQGPMLIGLSEAWSSRTPRRVNPDARQGRSKTQSGIYALDVWWRYTPRSGESLFVLDRKESGLGRLAEALRSALTARGNNRSGLALLPRTGRMAARHESREQPFYDVFCICPGVAKGKLRESN